MPEPAIALLIIAAAGNTLAAAAVLALALVVGK